MKLFMRHSICFVTIVFIIWLIMHNQYFKASKQENVTTKTIGRYVHPFNSTINGFKEFLFTENTFKLFKRLTDELEAGITVNNISLASYIKHLKPVTAISSNHFIELMARIDIMAKFMPEKLPIIVYDLGLNEHEVKALRNISFVAHRIFDFSIYPKSVRHLGNYAWKPLIIQKILSEFGGALWMDSCIVFQENYEKIVRYTVKEDSSFLYYIRRAGNTIVSGTEPRMFEFLPMKGVKEMTNYMPQAGAMLIYNTDLVRRDIMKWVLACCLIEDCIAPSGSTHECGDNYPADKFENQSKRSLAQASPELLSRLGIRKREELWGRDAVCLQYLPLFEARGAHVTRQQAIMYCGHGLSAEHYKTTSKSCGKVLFTMSTRGRDIDRYTMS